MTAGHQVFLLNCSGSPAWRNWQTQGTQNPPTSRSSRFESESGHHLLLDRQTCDARRRSSRRRGRRRASRPPLRSAAAHAPRPGRVSMRTHRQLLSGRVADSGRARASRHSPHSRSTVSAPSDDDGLAARWHNHWSNNRRQVCLPGPRQPRSTAWRMSCRGCAWLGRAAVQLPAVSADPAGGRSRLASDDIDLVRNGCPHGRRSSGRRDMFSIV